MASLEDVDGASVEAVAHRVVHGGATFREPVVIDDAVEGELASLTELAPLHNGPALAAIQEARRLLHDVPHVAVFDTAFHATLPEEASTYALPRRVREDWGIRRYGFHGMSVQWAAERVQVPRLVVCHLGGGCSVTAVRDGRSVDTTMGFTPLDGVPMATRAGSVDPGALVHLLRTGRLTVEELDRALEHESGLLGLSGSSGSVRELENLDTGAAEAKPTAEAIAETPQDAGREGLSVGWIERNQIFEQRLEVLGASVHGKSPDILQSEVSGDFADAPGARFVCFVRKPY